MPRVADVKPITYLKSHAAEVLRDVEAHRRPMTITQNGEAKAVVMDVKTYDQWRAAMALLRMVAEGETDARRNRTVTTTEAFGRAREALRRARDRG